MSSRFITVGRFLIKKNEIMGIKKMDRFIYGDVCKVYVSKRTTFRLKKNAPTQIYSDYPEICYINKMELYDTKPFMYLIDFNGNNQSNKDLTKFLGTIEKECPKCKSIDDLD